MITFQLLEYQWRKGRFDKKNCQRARPLQFMTEASSNITDANIEILFLIWKDTAWVPFVSSFIKINGIIPFWVVGWKKSWCLFSLGICCWDFPKGTKSLVSVSKKQQIFVTNSDNYCRSKRRWRMSFAPSDQIESNPVSTHLVQSIVFSVHFDYNPF